jgi:superoxide dismutase, Fe-Mn family
MDIRPQALTLDRLGTEGSAMAPAWQLALAANFGSVDRWAATFTALAADAGRALLVFQPHDGRLVHQAADDCAFVTSGSVPLLALNRDERTGSSEGPAVATQRVQILMAAVDGVRVQALYRQAVFAASEPWAAGPEEVADALVLDVRRAGAFEAANTMLPGAAWRDPGTVDQWGPQLSADRVVIVYCVHGHEVSRATALRLRALGLQAHFLSGGIEAWAAAGRPLQARSEST